MWVDESAAGDDPAANGTGADDMAVTVEGEEYTADVNFDMNSDGVDDTAVIERPDGSAQAFIDEDGDGDADGYIKLDEQGDVVARAAYNEATGDWVARGGAEDATETGETHTSKGGMTADMPSGDVSLGPPTVDTNSDGVADTAVVRDDAGNTLMFTDVDGDGAADIVVVLTPNGESTTYEHTDDGAWTPVEGGTGADSPDFAADSGAGAEPETGAAGVSQGVEGWGGGELAGVARINPTTGQWISPN